MRRQIVSSKLTTRYRATIPKKIRRMLDLRPGDSVIFEVTGNETVVLRKATAVVSGFARVLESALVSEWLSENDEKAYGNL
jgi:AbrB family looped-hinge helix DNA binding protein